MGYRTSVWLVCDLCEDEGSFYRSDLAAVRVVASRNAWLSQGVVDPDGTESMVDLCPSCAAMYRRDMAAQNEEGSL